MDLYTLNVPVGTVFALNYEIENTFKGTGMRLDLLMLVKEASGVWVLWLAFIGWIHIWTYSWNKKVFPINALVLFF